MNKLKIVISCILSFLIMILCLRAGYLSLNPPIPETGPVGENLPIPDGGNAFLYFLASGLSLIALIIGIYRSLKK
ncbi:hypothetical protein [Bacillus sp. FSL K6-6540]|uniref:hypothetical protein n=1 Tax=Bacillus sp. FSL K6-6540 TaxID=2921512 RepID=UPI0030F91A09